MTDRPGPSPFASTGKPGRVIGPRGSGIDVHIDVIRASRRGSEYQRTTTGVERGGALTVHRRRVPEELRLEVVISDVEPIAGTLVAGALGIGGWELDHSSKTLQRLRDAQAADGELRVWDGESYFRTPAGKQVWVLDKIGGPDLEGTEKGVARLTLTFGEQPRFATQFTSAIDDVDESLVDVTGGIAERGRQSTTEAGTDVSADIGAGVY